MNTRTHLWIAPWALAALLVSFPGTGSADEPAAAPAPAETSKPAVATLQGESAYVVDFLDYRLEIQLKIEKIWGNYLAKFGSQLKRGRAVFAYHVNPDGKITLVEPAGKTVDKDLAVLAHRSIVEANKVMVPFPPSVKAKHPSGYFNQIAFTVK